MANANIPRGLVPARSVSGQPRSGSLRQYVHDSGNGTAIFIGDPVTQTGASSTVNGQILPNVVQSATGDVVSGVCVGVLPDTRDSLTYCAASTTRIILVDDDPNTLFEIQDISTGTPLTAAAIGLNVNFVVGSGSTVTGLSAVTLDNTTEATTNTLDLKIIDFVNRADNEDAASAKWLVRINRHRYSNQVAGV